MEEIRGVRNARNVADGSASHVDDATQMRIQFGAHEVTMLILHQTGEVSRRERGSASATSVTLQRRLTRSDEEVARQGLVRR